MRCALLNRVCYEEMLRIIASSSAASGEPGSFHVACPFPLLRLLLRCITTPAVSGVCWGRHLLPHPAAGCDNQNGPAATECCQRAIPLSRYSPAAPAGNGGRCGVGAVSRSFPGNQCHVTCNMTAPTWPLPPLFAAIFLGALCHSCRGCVTTSTKPGNQEGIDWNRRLSVA